MTFSEYIRPELLILVPVLYILGAIIKDSAAIQNRYIPAILGLIGIALSLLYVLGTGDFSATGIFTGITQGILVAGAAVYTNELITQLLKHPEDNGDGQ
jgi:1,4-dihydroxy-2-naphthoate octaprenyltransferase